MQPLFKNLSLLLTAFTLMGCSAPKTYLDDYIEENGFIPYVLTMSGTRVGTFYEGGNKYLQLVQEAESCMPARTTKPFVKTEPTELPPEYRSVQLGFNAEVNDALKSGTASVSLNLSASHVKTVEIEFGDANIEYLVIANVLNEYKTSMSPECQETIEKYAFVSKSLRVKSMSFRFQSKSGGLVDLDADLNKVVHIDAGANWSIENKHTLVIDSPKAIGYNMAKLNSEGTLDYAVKTDAKDHWIFKKASELFGLAIAD